MCGFVADIIPVVCHFCSYKDLRRDCFTTEGTYLESLFGSASVDNHSKELSRSSGQ